MSENNRADHDADNDIVITGIGLVTALGVGVDDNWEALSNGAAPVFDTETFSPYTVHPMPDIDWTNQISKRDQRQMGPWQRAGTFTAGLALDDAGLKDAPELLATMDMIVAAGTGERDGDVDQLILSKAGDDTAVNEKHLNEILTTELRPTLFLAQLSNLLAGNISIVHKVTGSSRTFMGAEGAGISAVMTAASRIRSGQSTHILVGGSYNAEHIDSLLSYELNQHLMRGGWSSVWQRDNADGGGVITGSGGAFLVLESRAHAKARDARIYATLSNVAADYGADTDEQTTQRLSDLSDKADLHHTDMIISTATGAKTRTKIEKDFMAGALKATPVRNVTSAVGTLNEVQFPLAIAVAALSIYRKQPLDQIDSRFESSCSTHISNVGVLTVGHEDSEGVAIVSASSKGDA